MPARNKKPSLISAHVRLIGLLCLQAEVSKELVSGSCRSLRSEISLAARTKSKEEERLLNSLGKCLQDTGGNNNGGNDGDDDDDDDDDDSSSFPTGVVIGVVAVVALRSPYIQQEEEGYNVINFAQRQQQRKTVII